MHYNALLDDEAERAHAADPRGEGEQEARAVGGGVRKRRERHLPHSVSAQRSKLTRANKGEGFKLKAHCYMSFILFSNQSLMKPGGGGGGLSS